MIEEKFNPRFDIPIQQLEDQLQVTFNGDYEGYTRVVPLRDIKQVKGIHHFTKAAFQALIRGIPLRMDSKNKIYPYQNSTIDVFEREPKGAKIGQTFILRRKVESIMEGLEKQVFNKFIVKGLSKRSPVQVYGLDADRKKAIAFYIPPFVEIHGNHAVLIDGMHRSYICDRAGTTIEAVHLSNIEIPLPFDPISWQETQLMTEKPSKKERYKNLKAEYFRDLSAVGIDG